MEFKYRACDDRPTAQTSYPTPHYSPLPITTFFTEPPLFGGLSNAGTSPIPNTSRVSVNDSAREALWREIEKAHIRREIIAREVARRLELEEEVRRELALERGGEVWGIAAPHHVFSFEETLAMRLNHTVMTPFESVYDVPLPKPPLPQLALAPVADGREPSPEISKDRVIILEKPDPSVYAAKRKAVTPPVVEGCEIPPFRLRKKPKEEWSCALCRVSATSEKGLNSHLQGKKHRAKEAALRQQKVGTSTRSSVSSTKSKSPVKPVEAIAAPTSGMDAKLDSGSLQPGINGGDIDQTVCDKGVADSKKEVQLVQNSQNTGLKNGAATNAALKGSFWCEICKVRTYSLDVMESHKKGKRHLKLMKKLNSNCGSSEQTSSESQEAEITSEQ